MIVYDVYDCFRFAQRTCFSCHIFLQCDHFSSPVDLQRHFWVTSRFCLANASGPARVNLTFPGSKSPTPEATQTRESTDSAGHRVLLPDMSRAAQNGYTTLHDRDRRINAYAAYHVESMLSLGEAVRRNSSEALVGGGSSIYLMNDDECMPWVEMLK